MRVVCPVCRRRARVAESGRVARHNDNAAASCPMGGRRVPKEWIEEGSTGR